MINQLHLPEVEQRLKLLENAVRTLCSTLSTSQKSFNDEVLPIKEIIGKGKLMSAPTFYKHVKSGKITLLKLGGRSYVKQEDFYKVFKEIDRSAQKLERAENA